MVTKIQLAQLSRGKHLIELGENTGRSEKSETTIHTYIVQKEEGSVGEK
jgi:hypothetical protein